MAPARKLPRLARFAPAYIVLGLLVGFTAGPTYAAMGYAAMGLLALLMTIALAEVDFAAFAAALRRAPLAPAVNLGLLSPLILAYGSLAPRALWPGFAIMASVPSAISLVPFTAILGGDLRLSVAGTLLYYLLALASTPLLALALLGAAVDPGSLLTTLLVLILVPIVASRGVRRLGPPPRVLAGGRNGTFFALTLTIGAANRPALLAAPALLLDALAAAVAAALTSALLLVLLLRRTRLPAASRTSLLLFATLKNHGLAATVVLALLGPVPALLPPTVTLVFEVAWITGLSRFLPTARAPPAPGPAPGPAALAREDIGLRGGGGNGRPPSP